MHELSFVILSVFRTRLGIMGNYSHSVSVIQPPVWIASETLEVWIMDQDNAVTVIGKLAEICKDGDKGI